MCVIAVMFLVKRLRNVNGFISTFSEYTYEISEREPYSR